MCNQEDVFKIYYYCLLGCSIPTALSCLFMIFVYLKYEEIRGVSLKIVFWMSVNDLIRSIFYMVPLQGLEQSSFCIAYGVVVNVAFTNNAIWAIYIVSYLYRMLFSFDRENSLYFSHTLFVTLVLVPAYHIAAVFMNAYGFNYGICTFKSNESGLIWRSIQEGLIIIVIVISIGMYVMIYYKTKRYQILSISDIIFQKGMIFVIITIVSLTFLIIFRYIEIEKKLCEVYVLGILSIITISLHGFLNFLGVLCNSNIRNSLSESVLEHYRGDSHDISTLFTG